MDELRSDVSPVARALSGLLALAYIVTAWVSGGPVGGIRMFMFCVLPVMCIWFSDAMGAYTGWSSRGPSITQASPGSLVALLGWVVLLMPAVVAAIVWMRT